MSRVKEREAPFLVEASFAEERAVLSVRGEIDASSGPRLDAFLDAVMVSGYSSVVLDLAEVQSLDHIGLQVITFAAGRFVALGGELTFRSPPAVVTKILDSKRVAGFPRLELPVEGPDRLGPEGSVASIAPTGHGTPRPADGLSWIMAIPPDDEVIDAALRLVVALARVTIGGADGVSVSLRRHGNLGTVAASDQTISDMDAIQYSTGEGPCVEASIEGHWFHVESLETEARWPAFTPGAHDLGINAILSSPLLARGAPVGALNIYSRTTAGFAPEDQELASVFAAEASTILADAGLDVTDDEASSRFQEALRSREVIAQAQGVIMERDGIGEEDAFDILRRFSVRNGGSLCERAKDVLVSTRWSHTRPKTTAGPNA